MLFAIPWSVVLDVLKRVWVGLRAALGVGGTSAGSNGADNGGPAAPTLGPAARSHSGPAVVGDVAGPAVGSIGGDFAGRDHITIEGPAVQVVWLGSVEGQEKPIGGRADVAGLPALAGGAVWSGRELRGLIRAACPNERLDGLLFDWFPMVYHASRADDYNVKVRRLVEAALLDGRVGELLEAVHEVSPYAFGEFVKGRPDGVGDDKRGGSSGRTAGSHSWAGKS